MLYQNGIKLIRFHKKRDQRFRKKSVACKVSQALQLLALSFRNLMLTVLVGMGGVKINGGKATQLQVITSQCQEMLKGKQIFSIAIEMSHHPFSLTQLRC